MRRLLVRLRPAAFRVPKSRTFCHPFWDARSVNGHHAFEIWVQIPSSVLRKIPKRLWGRSYKPVADGSTPSLPIATGTPLLILRLYPMSNSISLFSRWHGTELVDQYTVRDKQQGLWRLCQTTAGPFRILQGGQTHGYSGFYYWTIRDG